MTKLGANPKHTVKDSVIEKTGTIELILAMIDIDLESSESN